MRGAAWENNGVYIAARKKPTTAWDLTLTGASLISRFETPPLEMRPSLKFYKFFQRLLTPRLGVRMIRRFELSTPSKFRLALFSFHQAQTWADNILYSDPTLPSCLFYMLMQIYVSKAQVHMESVISDDTFENFQCPCKLLFWLNETHGSNF